MLPKRLKRVNFVGSAEGTPIKGHEVTKGLYSFEIPTVQPDVKDFFTLSKLYIPPDWSNRSESKDRESS